MKDEITETVSLKDKGAGGESGGEDEGEEESERPHEAGKVPWGSRPQGARGEGREAKAHLVDGVECGEVGEVDDVR